MTNMTNIFAEIYFPSAALLLPFHPHTCIKRIVSIVPPPTSLLSDKTKYNPLYNLKPLLDYQPKLSRKRIPGGNLL